MRTLTTFLCLTFAVLLFSAGEGFALPPCPEDQDQRFHNCFGTYTFASGNKYVGEWRDDKQHGQGIETSADGDNYIGEFKDEKGTDRAPSPLPTGTNTLVNGGVT